MEGGGGVLATPVLISAAAVTDNSGNTNRDLCHWVARSQKNKSREVRETGHE